MRRHWSGFAPNSKFTQCNFHYTCNLVLHNALWVTPPSFFSFQWCEKASASRQGQRMKTLFFRKNEGKRRHEKQEIREKERKNDGIERRRVKKETCEQRKWEKKHFQKKKPKEQGDTEKMDQIEGDVGTDESKRWWKQNER